jgi:hypothetical protein
LAIGDVNGDGHPDLVVANVGSNTVSVLLGNGAGGFGAQTTFATGSEPYSVAIGDLNGDGYPDLAVANYASYTVSALLGNGAGGFGAQTTFATGANPYSVAIGDVNGDGRPDLVVANAGSNMVSALLGNGAGGFGAQTTFATGINPYSVAIGDVNGDGRPDLVVANEGSNTVSVLLALETTRTTLAVSPNPAVAGAPVTLTATVTVPSPGSGAPTDSVRFFDGTTLLGTSPVNGGTAGLALFAPYLGSRTLSAVYKGDGKLLGSFAPPATEFVASTAAATITSVTDVPKDQGGQVRLVFARSPFDYVGSGTPITGYKVLRRAIVAAPAAAVRPAARSSARPDQVELLGWVEITTVTATGDDSYQLVVPTLADSNSSGVHRNVFLTRALTAVPTTYYDSPPDSGYSVDNIPPVPPTPFVAAYAAGATNLHWGANSEPDFWYYKLYRGTSAAFVPAAGNQIASKSDTGYVDVGPAGLYYKLSAVDVNGNESGYSLVTPSATTGVGDTGPLAFALEPPANPAVGGRLMVAFSLPNDARATLEVVDVSGRRTVAREVGSLGAGRHSVDLAAGRAIAPGLYWVRLAQGAEQRVRRVAIVE